MKNNEYNLKESEFIRDNFGVLSIEEMSKILNRSTGSISSFIFRNKIKKKIELFDGELVKPIFNGKYQISNFGRVFNHLNFEIKSYDANGYRRITLSPTEKKKEKFFVHRLVALNFLEIVPGKDFVNHKDNNRSNNNVSNLEWVSSSENELHKMKTKPEIKKHLSLINSKKHSEEKLKVIEEVRKICKLLLDGHSVSEIAKMLNINSKRVSAIKNKRLWVSISKEYFSSTTIP